MPHVYLSFLPFLVEEMYRHKDKIITFPRDLDLWWEEMSGMQVTVQPSGLFLFLSGHMQKPQGRQEQSSHLKRNIW